MFKKSDYIIISIITFFLGIFIISQTYAVREVKNVIQPQSNEVLALEVAKVTKTNAQLRLEVQNLTHDLDAYKNSSLNSSQSYDKYKSDLERMDLINGLSAQSGQGVIIKITGNLSAPQIIDLVNAIKNIGGEIMSINRRENR